jgi:hypothetical protein
VTFPANPAAQISSVKSAIDGIATVRDAEAFLRDVGRLSNAQATAFISRFKSLSGQRESDELGAEGLGGAHRRRYAHALTHSVIPQHKPPSGGFFISERKSWNSRNSCPTSGTSTPEAQEAHRKAVDERIVKLAEKGEIDRRRSKPSSRRWNEAMVTLGKEVKELTLKGSAPPSPARRPKRRKPS